MQSNSTTHLSYIGFEIVAVGAFIVATVAIIISARLHKKRKEYQVKP